MPSSKTKRRALKDLGAGKSASTAAGEFVREEMRHIRQGKHGAKNTKQAIAIGLSEARRAGIPAKPGAKASGRIKRKAAQESRRAGKKPSATRSRATQRALRRQPHEAASRAALSRQAKASAARRRKAGGSNSPAAVARRAAETRKRRPRRAGAANAP